ncbi:methyltransferase [Thalassoporum mexicanum PCC 7367]|uniref:RsmD family RNA methyltransferase n=1 Tax=Thalassoporum mexicanum TaxID=3457544 RepID=UPI00029F89F3|nr:RsmD family RNA methyltransferase [Pseudanabaena sp. PCC 7367]AFY71239.1 methyltransferase [Pseudanabaena sp. PCC 7367]
MSLRVGDRKLKTLAGEATRPTASRVREAVFNIWQNKVPGCWWLDLCAGSGAMGAEAILRGAEFVVGIERSAAACNLIKQNWRQVAASITNNQQEPKKSSEIWQLHRGDLLKVLPKLIKQVAVNRPEAVIDRSQGDRANAKDLILHQKNSNQQGFDLVYFDPPYQSDLYLPVLQLLPDLLNQNAIVAAEHARKQQLPDRVGDLQVSDRRNYGSTSLTFYTLRS